MQKQESVLDFTDAEKYERKKKLSSTQRVKKKLCISNN